MKAIHLLGAVALFAAPTAVHAQASMPGMDMTPAPPREEPVPITVPSDHHGPHAAPVLPTPPQDQADPNVWHVPAVPPDRHSGMDGMDGMDGMPGMSPEDARNGTMPAPEVPSDHAADALFDPAAMALSRRNLEREIGAFRGSMMLFDLAEYQARPGGDGYRWASDAWFGGDIDRLQIKTEGEGSFGKPIEDFEIQALYSRAISPFWNVQIGLRHDIAPNPSLTHAVIGVEGFAPYWLHATGQLFLSNRGDVLARIEGSYDERITQKLIFQPRVELNFAMQDMSAVGVGSGLVSFDMGARLRYEFRKEFAPYVGVEWSGMTGNTARYARLAGDKPNAVNVVAGIRFWF